MLDRRLWLTSGSENYTKLYVVYLYTEKKNKIAPCATQFNVYFFKITV